MKICFHTLFAAGVFGCTAWLQAGQEDLDAPPVVTAKSWAIADARSGEVLWQHEADEPRKAASTAKMMCAYTVLRLAEKDPAVLDEWVTFSKLADSTAGSTSGIKAGERATVRDCLHGLLLPSGNDAGNALAQHFNDRLEPPDAALLKAGLDNAMLKSRVNFLAEMNRNAKEAGMARTFYRSPFGDGGSEKDFTTTAADLCRLAWTAMKMPAFRQMVSTRRYEGEVKGPGGATRKITWENSNELLGLDMGYDGIKTGLTTSAGNCLVASGHRGEDHLYVVVLGSTSRESRFGDTRNLFRWAWTKR